MIIFRQLFDETSSTYTYLLADPVEGEAILIDPVVEQVQRDLGLLNGLGLRLRYVLETHVHADHVTGAALLRAHTDARVGVSRHGGAPCADLQLVGGEVLTFGDELVHVLATPGHTPGCLSYRWRDRVFTGDALLIGGCGRTDFQGGDAGTLYDSITNELFTLPGDTLVYPGHDYEGRRVSTIAQESQTNPRLGNRDRADFIALMNSLQFPKPRLIEVAVPANRLCGRGVDAMAALAAG